jgi:hypothetical protein
MNKTINEFVAVLAECKALFEKKTLDYGVAWRILRPSSITDQIYIKAQRIRSIQTKEVIKINESQKDEFIGIINYAAMGLIQLEIGFADFVENDNNKYISMYNQQIEKAIELMKNKNNDYDEAWRNMRVSSITDLILMKIHRTKQIENNNGNTLVSEGIDANYLDMINYSVFALILLANE